MKTDLQTAGTLKVPVETAAPEAVRQAGLAWLERLGVDPAAVTSQVPHRRLERWKYTPVQGILAAPLDRAGAAAFPASIQANPVPGLDAYLAVFVNGKFDAGASSLPVVDGVEIEVAESIETKGTDWFSEIHAAVAPGGLRVKVAAGVVVDRPIVVHEIFTGHDEAAFACFEVVAAERSEVELVNWVSSVEGSKGFVSTVWQVDVAANASVGMDVVACDEVGLHRLVSTRVEQAASSRFRIHTATISGDWVRNDLHIALNGPGADAVLHGTFLPTGAERIDNHTTVDHRAPHCTSSELYRGVLYDESTGVFNGKVFVRPDAQQTNAYQQSNNILASDRATMNAKPELEIYADDVKCSHGCTIGQLDEDAMFYCQARGINAVQARALLVQAFIADVIEGFKNEEVRLELMHLYARRHGWMLED